MKNNVEVKTKTLAGILAATLGVLLLFYCLLPTVLLSIGDWYHRQGNTIAALTYYNRMDHFFPNHSTTAEALDKAAEITNNNNLLMISSSGVGNPSHTGGYLSEESEAYYKKLVERFPDTWQGKRAKVKLNTKKIKNLIHQQRIEDALDMIKEHYETINANTHTNYWDPSVVLEAVISLKAQGLYDEALRFLKYIMDRHEEYGDTRILELTADLHAFLGNQREAEKYYTRLLEENANQIEMELQHLDYDHAEGFISYLQERRQQIINKMENLTDFPKQHGSIIGTINLKNTPLDAIPVFLQPQNDPSGGIIFGSTTTDTLWGLSDDKGKFSFDYITPGRYSLGFVADLDRIGDTVLKGGFFPQTTIYIHEGESYHWNFDLVDTLKIISPCANETIIDDKVHFKWESFEEAAYYTLDLGTYSFDGGGSSSVNLNEKIYTNEVIFSIDELTYTPSGMRFDDEGPTPDSFFGFAHPLGKYFWGVNAHDAEGNILTSSRGYLQSQNSDFHFKERDLRVGDQHLLKRRFTEAIDAYEEDLLNNPNDVYALSMLGKLYGLSYGHNEKYPFRDIDKAITYYERIYEITKDPRFLENNLEFLSRD